MEKSLQGQVSLNNTTHITYIWGFSAHIYILKTQQRACSQEPWIPGWETLDEDEAKTTQEDQVKRLFVVVWG